MLKSKSLDIQNNSVALAFSTGLCFMATLGGAGVTSIKAQKSGGLDLES